MSGAGAYFESLQRSWCVRAAEASSGAVDVETGGWRVRIEAAPASLATELARAFDEANGPPRAPDLRVRVATGERPPVPGRLSWGPNDRLHFHDGRFEIHAAPGAALSAFDHVAARGITWLPDAELPYWERGAPLRVVLAWFALRRATLLLHGAGVAERGRAALLVGSGGAGKTTTALAASSGGMDYLGDDYVFVRLQPVPTIARAFATAKVDRRGQTLLSELDSAVALAESGFPTDSPAPHKAVLYLAGTAALDVAESPIAAIVVSRVTPQFGVRRLAAGEALRVAIPSALFQLPYERPLAFPIVAELMRRTPCYQLDTGPDPRRAARALRALVHPADRVAP
jgi:hypothetical protein